MQVNKEKQPLKKETQKPTSSDNYDNLWLLKYK